MTNQVSHFYETEVEWTSARRASLRSAERPVIQVAPPPEFKGEAGMWTPEHLYVASVNTCFVMTFLAIAELSELDFASFASKASGKLEKVDYGHRITEVVLNPTITVRHHRDVERALRLLNKAERNCLITDSIKTAVRIEPEINSEESDAAETDRSSPLVA